MLVVFTVSEANIIFNGREGKQVLDYIIRAGYGSREYLVNGSWSTIYNLSLGDKILGSRYCLEKYLPEIESLSNVWKYIKKNNLEKIVKGDKILEDLAKARLFPEKLRLFSPWGPRYNKCSPLIKENDSEIRTLNEIKKVFDMLKENAYSIDFLLMPADSYGTEINSLSPIFVVDYFKSLEDCASRILGEDILKVKLWSKIRAENMETYKQLKEETNNNFFSLLSFGEYERAVKVAQFFNPNSEKEKGKEGAKERAREYCLERIIEARIISEVYNPIKLSLVRKEKDNLDGPLKRIYLVKNRAPWL